MTHRAASQAAANAGQSYVWTVKTTSSSGNAALLDRLLAVVDGCLAPDPAARSSAQFVRKTLAGLQKEAATGTGSAARADRVRAAAAPTPVPTSGSADQRRDTTQQRHDTTRHTVETPTTRQRPANETTRIRGGGRVVGPGQLIKCTSESESRWLFHIRFRSSLRVLCPGNSSSLWPLLRFLREISDPCLVIRDLRG